MSFEIHIRLKFMSRQLLNILELIACDRKFNAFDKISPKLNDKTIQFFHRNQKLQKNIFLISWRDREHLVFLHSLNILIIYLEQNYMQSTAFFSHFSK